jgi:hypothetical protein
MRSDAVPNSGHDSPCALDELTPKSATWFEFVEDDALIAFRQPLLRALAQSIAVGELVGGPRAGTLVVIPAFAPADEGVARFIPEEPVNAFAVD